MSGLSKIVCSKDMHSSKGVNGSAILFSCFKFVTRDTYVLNYAINNLKFQYQRITGSFSYECYTLIDNIPKFLEENYPLFFKT